jgi:hypothetical protein
VSSIGKALSGAVLHFFLHDVHFFLAFFWQFARMAHDHDLNGKRSAPNRSDPERGTGENPLRKKGECTMEENTTQKDWAQNLIDHLGEAGLQAADNATCAFCHCYAHGDTMAALDKFIHMATEERELNPSHYMLLVFPDGSCYADWKQDIEKFYPDLSDLVEEDADVARLYLAKDVADETVIKSVIRDIINQGAGIVYADAGNGSGGPGYAGPDTLQEMLDAGDFDDVSIVNLDRELLDSSFKLVGQDPEDTDWVQIEFSWGEGDNPYHQIAWIW